MKSVRPVPVFLCLVIASLIVPGAGSAQTGWGFDPCLSTAWLDSGSQGPVSIFVLPDGSGFDFTEAMVEPGILVDATIHLELLDYGGFPIQDFPSEDMWLEWQDENTISCQLGTCPGAATDDAGQTSWTTPLRAGGYSEQECHVLVNGMPLCGPGLPLHCNSADINGDLMVDLVDVSLFASDLFSGYNYRSDFHFDGVINIADVAKLAQGMSSACQ